MQCHLTGIVVHFSKLYKIFELMPETNAVEFFNFFAPGDKCGVFFISTRQHFGSQTEIKRSRLVAFICIAPTRATETRNCLEVHSVKA